MLLLHLSQNYTTRLLFYFLVLPKRLFTHENVKYSKRMSALTFCDINNIDPSE